MQNKPERDSIPTSRTMPVPAAAGKVAAGKVALDLFSDRGQGRAERGTASVFFRILSCAEVGVITILQPTAIIDARRLNMPRCIHAIPRVTIGRW